MEFEEILRIVVRAAICYGLVIGLIFITYPIEWILKREIKWLREKGCEDGRREDKD